VNSLASVLFRKWYPIAGDRLSHAGPLEMDICEKIASGASCPHFRRDWSYIVYIEASRFGCFEIRLTA